MKGCLVSCSTHFPEDIYKRPVLKLNYQIWGILSKLDRWMNSTCPTLCFCWQPFASLLASLWQASTVKVTTWVFAHPSFRPLSPKAPCTEGMLASMDIPFCALSLRSDDCRNLPLAFLLRLFSLKHLQLPYHCQLPRLLLLLWRYDLFTFECYLTCEMAVYSRRMSHSTQRRLNIGSFFKSKIRIPVKSPRILIVILLKVNWEAFIGNDWEVDPRRYEERTRKYLGVLGF